MRSDRLFQALQILRRRRICTAEQLAEELEVSVRTVYRYMSSLSSSGVPIEAEPGVGYRLRNFDLPPLMFSREEVVALVLGARFVRSWADADLADGRAATFRRGNRTAVSQPALQRHGGQVQFGLVGKSEFYGCAGRPAWFPPVNRAFFGLCRAACCPCP